MQCTFGDCVLDTDRRELRRAGVPVKLERKVYEVLAYLVQHRERLVTKAELLEQVWPGIYVDEIAVARCITAVCQAVGDSRAAQRVIQTRHGQGYCFVAPVTVDDARLPTTKVRRLSPRPAMFTGSTLEIPIRASVPALSQQETETRPATQQRLTETCSPSIEQLPLADMSGEVVLDSERREVTVLTCTVIDRSVLTTCVAPDDWMHLRDAAFTQAQRVAHRYGGSVQDFLDDGFLALFGVSVSHEEHAWQALLAAMDLRQQLHADAMASGLRAETGLALRMGVHTAEWWLDGSGMSTG
ncbi:MAG TPA: winged helix-turn-helix domain-containing protein [Alphaproteobacteria bacterium]|nr:winged helix-turn-helix domain-containing protein [Alphaproteobacteria bacterium]